jgi:uncharacterized DUF497 family protein
MFTWDSRKAIINLEKHGVSFEEAAALFADPEGLDWEDLEHSQLESRFKRLGVSLKGRVLIVVLYISESKGWRRKNPNH